MLKIAYNVVAQHLTNSVTCRTEVVGTFSNREKAEQLAENLERKSKNENQFIWYVVRKNLKNM